LIGPITRAKAKRINEAFKRLICDVWVEQVLRILFKVASNMKLSSKKDKSFINMNQVRDMVV
jgi:hypothetical protein